MELQVSVSRGTLLARFFDARDWNGCSAGGINRDPQPCAEVAIKFLVRVFLLQKLTLVRKESRYRAGIPEYYYCYAVHVDAES